MKQISEKSVIYIAIYKYDKKLSYIGQTVCNDLQPKEALINRVSTHKRDATKIKDKFHKTMLNLGLENWDWSILEICDFSDAGEREKYFIAVHKPELNTAHTKEIRATKKKNDYGMGKVTKNISQDLAQTDLRQRYSQLYETQKPTARLKSNLEPDVIYKSIREASKKDMVSINKVRKSCQTGKMLQNGIRYAFLDINRDLELTKGHYKDIYIGQSGLKIKNLVNLQIYKNSTEAAEIIGVRKQSIPLYAKGTYLIAKEKHVLCYLDDDGNEIRDPKGRHEKALEKIKNKESYQYVAWPVYFDSYEEAVKEKQVRYFKSIRDLCEKLNIKNNSHIQDVCKGLRFHCEKFRIAFWNSATNKPELKERHERKSKKIIRAIICLDDGKKFNNCVEAGNEYNVSASQIGNCVRGKQKAVEIRNQDTGKLERKLRFAELDAAGKLLLNEKHDESLSWKGDYEIKYIKDGKVFIYASIAEACRKIVIPKKTLTKYCKDPSRELLSEHEGKIFCRKYEK